MSANIYHGLVDKSELLNFSQNFGVQRSYMGSTLFPDRKTQYIYAEFRRLCKNGNLPMVAKVHARDTEAHIGSRRPIESVAVEELLIKEKINSTEELRNIFHNMRVDDVTNYVFDDFARLAESTVARAELAKMDAISKGEYVISENGLDMNISYKIPDENFVSTSWDEDTDILDCFMTWSKIGRESGTEPNLAITSQDIVDKILRNKTIQKQMFGSTNVGRLPTLEEVNTLLRTHARLTISVNEDMYGIPSADGMTVSQGRFFPKDKISLVNIGNNGSVGVGLWGVTPAEDMDNETWTEKRESQYVTLTQWVEPDPTAVWTMAQALFFPVMPNAQGHVIATITDETTATPKAQDGGDDQKIEG